MVEGRPNRCALGIEICVLFLSCFMCSSCGKRPVADHSGDAANPPPADSAGVASGLEAAGIESAELRASHECSFSGQVAWEQILRRKTFAYDASIAPHASGTATLAVGGEGNIVLARLQPDGSLSWARIFKGWDPRVASGGEEGVLVGRINSSHGYFTNVWGLHGSNGVGWQRVLGDNQHNIIVDRLGATHNGGILLAGRSIDRPQRQQDENANERKVSTRSTFVRNLDRDGRELWKWEIAGGATPHQVFGNDATTFLGGETYERIGFVNGMPPIRVAGGTWYGAWRDNETSEVRFKLFRLKDVDFHAIAGTLEGEVVLSGAYNAPTSVQPPWGKTRGGYQGPAPLFGEVAKFGKDGKLAWEHRFPFLEYYTQVMADLVAVDSDGSVVVYVETPSEVAGHRVLHGHFIAKFDRDGRYLWSRPTPRLLAMSTGPGNRIYTLGSCPRWEYVSPDASPDSWEARCAELPAALVVIQFCP